MSTGKKVMARMRVGEQGERSRGTGFAEEMK
jgi:hypothetical protein